MGSAAGAPGRPKSDGQDCQGLPRWPTYALLAAAWRPPEQSCGLRSYLRPRARLATSTRQPIEPLPKALTPMTLKLQPVVSEVTRVTGRAIIKALLSGERPPTPRAQGRGRNCHQSEVESARALPGNGRTAPRVAWPQGVELSGFSHRQRGEDFTPGSPPSPAAAQRAPL